MEKLSCLVKKGCRRPESAIDLWARVLYKHQSIAMPGQGNGQVLCARLAIGRVIMRYSYSVIVRAIVHSIEEFIHVLRIRRLQVL